MIDKDSNQLKKICLFITVIIIGLLARCYDIGYNFDGDELFSTQLAMNSFIEVIKLSLQDVPHPPLHNILLHFWIKIFGHSEVSVRLLSVFFSFGFLLSVFMLLRRYVPFWFSLCFLIIFSISPFFVYYGTQARPYSLISLLFVLNLISFVEVMASKCGKKQLIIWAFSCLFLLYAQYFAIISIFLQIGLALFHLKLKGFKVLKYGFCGCVFILPWMLIAMGLSLLQVEDPVPHITWMTTPSLTDFAWYYVSIFGDATGFPARWLFGALIIPGIFYLYDIIKKKDITLEEQLLILLGIAVPIIMFLLSIWGPKPLFAGRQLIGNASAFLILVGLSISKFPRIFQIAVISFFVIWVALALPNAFPKYSKPPWKEISHHLNLNYDSAIVVTEENWVKMNIQWYGEKIYLRFWKELKDDEKSSTFLFVGRPGKQTTLQIAELENLTKVAVKKWFWGSKYGKHHQIILYELKN